MFFSPKKRYARSLPQGLHISLNYSAVLDNFVICTCKSRLPHHTGRLATLHACGIPHALSWFRWDIKASHQARGILCVGASTKDALRFSPYVYVCWAAVGTVRTTYRRSGERESEQGLSVYVSTMTLKSSRS